MFDCDVGSHQKGRQKGWEVVRRDIRIRWSIPSSIHQSLVKERERECEMREVVENQIVDSDALKKLQSCLSTHIKEGSQLNSLSFFLKETV